MLKTRLIPAAAGAYQYPLLIKSLMLSGRRYEKSHEIVYRDQVRYSYATFNERVARLANVLSEAGVKAGDTVAVMDWDSHRYLECMFAIPMIGAVLHTINIRLSPEQILYTMNHAEDRFVLVNSEFVPLYQAVAGQLATVERTILLTDGAEKSAELPPGRRIRVAAGRGQPALRLPRFRRELHRHHLLHHRHHRQSERCVFQPPATGPAHPGDGFDHRQPGQHPPARYQRRVHADHPDVPCPRLGHSVRGDHARGQAGLSRALRSGTAGRTVEAREGHLLHCVPTILQMVMNARAAQGVDFKGWKVIIGGSALNRSLYEAAKARGIQLTAAYGMSETCPLISCAYLNDELLAGSEDERTTYRIKAGVPVPLVDAAIMDEQGRFLPADGESQGELVLRSPWLTQGYFREPERGEELWRGGWMHTGDVATLDGMGFIEIRDRIKDVIKTGGEWLSSLELEDLISRHPAVREVAVVGVPIRNGASARSPCWWCARASNWTPGA